MQHNLYVRDIHDWAYKLANGELMTVVKFRRLDLGLFKPVVQGAFTLKTKPLVVRRHSWPVGRHYVVDSVLKYMSCLFPRQGSDPDPTVFTY